jgi:hypothetical protein
LKLICKNKNLNIFYIRPRLDGADAQVGEGVHDVEVELWHANVNLQSVHHFLSKLLRSFPRSVFKLVKDLKKDLKEIPILDMKSFYFIQSAYSIYLCMDVAIYLFYILLEVVNSDNDS